MESIIHCGQCGAKNPIANKFCGSCGEKIVTVGQPEQAISNRKTTHNSITCPVCNNNDQIQKLSSIVAAGTRETSGVSVTSERTDISGNQKYYTEGGSRIGSGQLSGNTYSSSRTSVNAVERTNLAKKITPPLEPLKPDTPSSDDGAFVGFVIAILIIATAMCFITGNNDVEVGIIVFFGIIGLAIAGLVSRRFSGAEKQRRAEEKKRRDKVHEEYLADVEKWKKAMQRWEQIYYCYRDDIVFLPGKSFYEKPEDTYYLCYSE